MKVAKYFFIFCLLHHLPLVSFSQKYNFKNYTVANGLGSSSVNHIFQDSKGYMWFATQGGGASRFNGKEFKNFTRADGLISNDVTYIAEDKQGNIWIGTAEGASKFNGLSFTNYRQKQGLSNGIVYNIYCDAKNQLWFALHDGGIKTFDGKKFTSVKGLPVAEAYCIAQNKYGDLWFGLVNRIVKYSHGRITDYTHSDLIKNKTFFSSMTDADGNIWFGSTTGDVVIIYPDNRIEKLELPAAIRKDFIGSIEQDKRGNVWFATDHGLLKYTGKEFKLFGEREGLSVNVVQAVMCDYEDNIWAGTLAGGVDLLSSEAFVHYSEKDGLTSHNVTAICSADAKTYYIGTGEGLFTFNPAFSPKFKRVAIKDVEKINISSMSIDKNGLLWLSAQEGVFVLEKKAQSYSLKKKYTEIAGHHIVSALKILHDSKGNCWIATFGSGIFSINGTMERALNKKSGFPSDKILTIYEDSKSRLWFGTQDAGLIKYDGKTFAALPWRERRIEEAVWSVSGDNKGNIFFGTGESGLCCFDGKHIINYTLKDGLSSNFIPVLQWDQHQNCLWLGSEKGLDQIRLGSDNHIANIRSYKESEGFNSVGLNQSGICLSATQPDEAGLIWLGTVNGLWLFNQHSDFSKNTPPKVQLTGIRLGFQKVDWKKLGNAVDQSTLPTNLELPYNKNHLTFEIQALTTQHVLYTYKLEGQDDEWSAPTKNNEITYANISPGQKYIFKAKAISSNGIISDETKPFSFSINPPWWSTWWFRSSFFFALMGSFTAFVKTREKALTLRNQKLEETVRQRTTEIEQQKIVVEKTLEEKEGLLEEKEILLKEIHHRVKNNLQTISSMLRLQSVELTDPQAKKAIMESQSRVRSIALVHQKLYQTDGLEKVELSAFINELANQVKSIYGEQSAKVVIAWNIPPTPMLIDTAIPLGLILNELLTNSFKYAFGLKSQGEIRIDLIHMEANKVQMRYWDNGPGIESEENLVSASTLGLRLIRLLSQQIGAAVNYTKANGSEFIFTFMLNM
jgi:two-component sensor histidine kinase/ligand-binding sensor domain-containing protein